MARVGDEKGLLRIAALQFREWKRSLLVRFHHLLAMGRIAIPTALGGACCEAKDKPETAVTVPDYSTGTPACDCPGPVDLTSHTGLLLHSGSLVRLLLNGPVVVNFSSSVMAKNGGSVATILRHGSFPFSSPTAAYRQYIIEPPEPSSCTQASFATWIPMLCLVSTKVVAREEMWPRGRLAAIAAISKDMLLAFQAT